MSKRDLLARTGSESFPDKPQPEITIIPVKGWGLPTHRPSWRYDITPVDTGKASKYSARIGAACWHVMMTEMQARNVSWMAIKRATGIFGPPQLSTGIQMATAARYAWALGWRLTDLIRRAEEWLEEQDT